MKLLLLFFVLYFPCAHLFADTSYDDDEGGLASSQKWVLGITATALLATAPATKRHTAQQARVAIGLAGLASYIGVSIYEESKKNRKEKLSFGLQDGVPSLVFHKQF